MLKLCHFGIIDNHMLYNKYPSRLTPCTGINLYSNKYPCQAVLDKGAWDAPPLNRFAVTELFYRLFLFLRKVLCCTQIIGMSSTT